MSPPKIPERPVSPKDLPDSREPLTGIPDIWRNDKIIESEPPFMQAPEDWPPPPEKDESAGGA